MGSRFVLAVVEELGRKQCSVLDPSQAIRSPDTNAGGRICCAVIPLPHCALAVVSSSFREGPVAGLRWDFGICLDSKNPSAEQIRSGQGLQTDFVLGRRFVLTNGRCPVLVCP